MCFATPGGGDLMTATTISAAHRAARNNGTLTLLDAGGADKPGYALFYAGTRPEDGGTPAGSALISVPFAYPAGVVQADGSLLLNTGAQVLAVADGVATWARIFNGNDVRIADCDASGPNGTGALRIAVSGGDGLSAQVWAGAAVQIASGTMG
jgi:hypothetical protein